MTCVHCATDWLSASVVFTHLPPVVPTLLFAFGAYLFWLNRAMLQQPASALNLSPTRYTPESVRAAAAEYARNPPDVRPFLPLATGEFCEARRRSMSTNSKCLAESRSPLHRPWRRRCVSDPKLKRGTKDAAEQPWQVFLADGSCCSYFNGARTLGGFACSISSHRRA